MEEDINITRSVIGLKQLFTLYSFRETLYWTIGIYGYIYYPNTNIFKVIFNSIMVMLFILSKAYYLERKFFYISQKG